MRVSTRFSQGSHRAGIVSGFLAKFSLYMAVSLAAIHQQT